MGKIILSDPERRQFCATQISDAPHTLSQLIMAGKWLEQKNFVARSLAITSYKYVNGDLGLGEIWDCFG